MNDPVFLPEEVIAMHEMEGEILQNVQYYFWLNEFDEDAPFRFLYFLELIFESGKTLLFTSGEDSSAIRISTAEALVKTAFDLKDLHGKVTIMRSQAAKLDFWKEAIGQKLLAIRLSKKEAGEYLADAFILDFGPENSVLVNLDPLGDGLRIDYFEE